MLHSRTSFASMTVCTPTVSACVGTWLTSPPKKRALASIVSTASVLIRVLDARLDPGSLNAMWPSAPIPKWNYDVCINSYFGFEPCMSYLQWRAPLLQPPSSSSRNLRILSEDSRRFHQECERTLGWCRCVWKSCWTCTNGSSLGDLAVGLKESVKSKDSRKI